MVRGAPVRALAAPLGAALAWATSMLAGGCGDGTPFFPEGAEQFVPPPSYQEYWEEAEACARRAGDFQRPEWYLVPGRGFDCPLQGTGWCLGYWSRTHRIFIAEEHLQSKWVVTHEMIHEILNDGGHPQPPFGTACAPLADPGW